MNSLQNIYNSSYINYNGTDNPADFQQQYRKSVC